jgi:hypothetical protein
MALVGAPALLNQAGPRPSSGIDEQKTLEIDLSTRVLERLLGWSKLFAFFVGIPLALLGVVLGWLGLKSYNDFQKMVKGAQEEFALHLKQAQEGAENAQKRVGQIMEDADKMVKGAQEEFALHLKQAQEGAENAQKRVGQIMEDADKVSVGVNQLKGAQEDIAIHLKQAQEGAENAQERAEQVQKRAEQVQERTGQMMEEADKLSVGFNQLKARYEEVSRLESNVAALSTKVDRIEEKVGFTTSSKLTPEVKRQLETAFYKFQEYLRKVGFQPRAETVFDIHAPAKSYAGMISSYDGEHQMTIKARYASDPDFVYHAYTDHILYPQPDKTWDETFFPVYAIRYALVTYFPCSFTGNPQWGGKTARLLKDGEFKAPDLTNRRKLTEIRRNFESAMIDGPEVWGGAFWELRGLLGQEAADRLLCRSWIASHPEDLRKNSGASFVQQLLAQDHAETGGHNAQEIRDLFHRRGWKDPDESATASGRTLHKD